MATSFMPCLPPSWQKLATLTKRVTENFGVGGGVRRCWRRLSITPNQQGVRQCAVTEQLQAEVLLGLLGKPAIQPDAPLLALYHSGSKTMPGLLCQVLTNEVSSMPTLELEGNSIDGLHHPWICISKSWVFRHGGCQMLATAFHSTACRQGGTSPNLSGVWMG